MDKTVKANVNEKENPFNSQIIDQKKINKKIQNYIYNQNKSEVQKKKYNLKKKNLVKKENPKIKFDKLEAKQPIIDARISPMLDIVGPKEGNDIHGPKISGPIVDINGPKINVVKDIQGPPRIDGVKDIQRSKIVEPALDINQPKKDKIIDIPSHEQIQDNQLYSLIKGFFLKN